jgi:hypothetical protein
MSVISCLKVESRHNTVDGSFDFDEIMDMDDDESVSAQS